MPARTMRKKPSTTRKPAGAPRAPQAGVEEQVQAALASLEKMSTRRDRDNLARFGITATKAYGVSMSNIQVLAKRLGRGHELANALWKTGWYEARMLTSFVDDPARVTSAQMDRWCRDFDNWGICDTVCFHLFDKTPPSRSWPASPCTTSAPATSCSWRACLSSSAPPPMSATSSRRG
jgi:hypothetical protein